LAKKGFVFFFGLEVSLRSFHVFIHLVLGLLDRPIYLGKSCFLCATMVLVFLSHRRRLIDWSKWAILLRLFSTPSPLSFVFFGRCFGVFWVFGQKGIDFVLSHLSIRSLSACLFLFSLSRRNGGSIGRLWWACGNGWVERGHFFFPSLCSSHSFRP